MEQRSITVGIGPVSFEELEAVARHGAQVVIADDAWAEVRKSRRSSKPWRMIRRRITGYPPASAPSRRVTSQSSCGPNSSAAWSAHMLPDRDLRSSVKWFGPSCCCELRPLPPAVPDSRRDPAQLRRHARWLDACCVRVRKPRLLRRPGSACHCALALMGEGTVRDRRHAPADPRCIRGGWHFPGHARREGRSCLDQRHRRHARHAGARDPRSSADCSKSPTSQPQ